VGQLLSGLRLRRAVAPALVLVRAQPAVEPVVPGPAGDLGLPPPLRPALRDPAPPAPPPRGPPGQLGRPTAAVARGDLPGRLDRGRPGRGDRPAERAEAPGPAGAGRLRGRRLPLGQLGPRPDRSPGRRRRHRGVGDPVRPGDPAPGRSAADLPAHRPLGASAPRPRPDRRRAVAVPFGARDPAAGPLVDLLGPRGLHGRLPAPARDAPAAAAGTAPPPPRCRRPGAAGAAHPRLHAGLQAGAALQRLPAGADQAERRAGHRRHPRGAPARHPHRRRRRAPGRHDHLRHRVPRHRLAGRGAGQGPRRAHSGRGLGGQPQGLWPGFTWAYRRRTRRFDPTST
jgi:hypothetical protein